MTAEEDLQAELDPRRWLDTGGRVIEHGLPALPKILTYQMSIPVCYWTADSCAVVAFVHFRPSPQDGIMRAMMTIVNYTRDTGEWTTPSSGSFASSSYAFDPVANPSYQRHLDGNAMTYGHTSQQAPTLGRPASTAFGYVAPEVRYLAVIQGGRQDRRELQSHFGAWIVCTEWPGTFDVAAFDNQGELLTRLEHPFPRLRARRRDSER